MHNILTNEAYTGIHYAFKRKFWYEDGVMHRQFRNKEEWIPIDDACIPQLIDPDTFSQCQKLLDKNKLESPRSNKHPEDTLCRSGLVVCGYCRSHMAVQRDKVRGFISYRCYKQNQGFKGKRECKGSYVRSYKVDAEAWKRQ